jgi:hypothetical protein
MIDEKILSQKAVVLWRIIKLSKRRQKNLQCVDGGERILASIIRQKQEIPFYRIAKVARYRSILRKLLFPVLIAIAEDRIDKYYSSFFLRLRLMKNQPRASTPAQSTSNKVATPPTLPTPNPPAPVSLFMLPSPPCPMTISIVNNQAELVKNMRIKVQTLKAKLNSFNRGILILRVMSSVRERRASIAKNYLQRWREVCESPSFGRKLGIRREIDSLERDVERLKESIEGNTCSAYNSNNQRGYDSSTLEGANYGVDDSKVKLIF